MGSKSSLITDSHAISSRANGSRNGGNGKPGGQSLYERLGGARAITAVVEAFYERVLADPQLKKFFEYTDMDWLKKSQAAFLSQAFGGPARYKGQDMKAAHAGLGITESDFNRVATHLAATMESLGVAPELIEEVIRVAATLAPQVVDRKAHGDAEVDTDHIVDLEGQIAAISKSQAVIEFNMDGTVIRANDNFLNALGYRLEEIQGKHHSIFCDPVYARGNDYRQFWADLNAGRFSSGEYKRFGKSGNEIWIQASYNPILDRNGKPYKVVKYATDITASKLRTADYEGQLAAISKSQAVIEFNLDGTIIKANENFLSTLGYSLTEIQGKHHSMFCDPAYAASAEYKQFWTDLNAGKFSSGEYKRFGKGGKEVWINASYNPIMDASGKPFKVVKYATDITATVKLKLGMAMLDCAPFNVMMADRNRVITYLNPASLATLKKLQQYLPVPADKVLGSNIDVFHKNPAHQQKIVGDSNNLPRKTVIQLGPESADLLVSPIFDQSGTFIGPMVTWEVITEKLENERKVKESAEREKAQAEDMRQKVDVMKKNIANLASSSEELNAISQQMSANSEETSAQATVVSGAAEEVSKNLQTVSTGTEEMMASIKEIAKNANEAAKVATSAVKVAEDTNATVTKLGDSSVEIGKVIKVITSIAQQTNLLALNATIEAARAGEAGKGFAVVANEVKELAKETAKATEEIGQKIQAIQNDSKGAVEAIAQITGIINQINEISTTIASAVEEQAATTTDIGRNVSEAAKGSQEIAHNILGVAQAAQSTTTGAANTQQAAGELARMSTELQEVVSSIRTS